MSEVNHTNCSRCKKQKDNPGAMCLRCRERDKKKNKSRFAHRVAAGKCPKCCRRHDRANGKDICEPCLVELRKGYHRRKAKRAGTGKCPQCNRELQPGYKRCETCNGRTRECGKRLKAERIEAGQCVQCGIQKPAGCRFRLCEACKAWHRERNAKLRDEVFAAYGGPVCACCGETCADFLQVDHINNDGAAHRKKHKGKWLYRWLRLQGFPQGFQILCANCNWGKGQCGGVCPHKLIWNAKHAL